MDEIECTKCIYNINNECEIGGWTIPKVGCPDGKEKPKTNADRIRSMTDLELANWLIMTHVCTAHFKDEWCKRMRNCQACWLEWLKQPAVDNGACSANETSEKVKNG